MTLRNKHLELRLSELETATENLSRFLRSPQVFPDESLAAAIQNARRYVTLPTVDQDSKAVIRTLLKCFDEAQDSQP